MPGDLVHHRWFQIKIKVQHGSYNTDSGDCYRDPGRYLERKCFSFYFVMSSLCNTRKRGRPPSQAKVKTEISNQTNRSSLDGRNKENEGVNKSEKGVKNDSNFSNQSVAERRILRSHYHALKISIAEEKEDLMKVDSDKFDALINKAQSLHDLVQRPREQVADAETLLDLTQTLATTVKRSQTSDGVTPADFVNGILRNYQDNRLGRSEINEGQPCISWGTIGFSASAVFQDAAGLCTMLGPLDIEPIKQRKPTMQKKRSKPSEMMKPDAVKDSSSEQRSETDKNVSVMFSVLKKHNKASLESLVLNRHSFSQTVENLFALSFLVKDGRVEINVDQNGNHIVAPRNSPRANDLASGKASYTQFVFRFDFKDWKLMKEFVETGKELMPHRTGEVQSSCSTSMQGIPSDSPEKIQGTHPETPIRKLTRNRGRVLHQAPVPEDNTENCNRGDADDLQQPLAKRSRRRLL